MLYVKTNSPLEALGLASMFEDNGQDEGEGFVNEGSSFDGGHWDFTGNWITSVGVLIDQEDRLCTYVDRAGAAKLWCDRCNASLGWEAIKTLLKAQMTPEIEVGQIVVFEYDGIPRVLIVKEVDSTHVKGLDVVNDFAFKSFKRSKISNLKQVKA